MRVLSSLVMTALTGTAFALGSTCAGAALLILWLAAGVELLRLIRSAPTFFAYGYAVFFLTLPAAAAGLLTADPYPVTALYPVIIAAVTDTAAYYVGRNFGRHKLCPRISPGKTVEGLCGGLAAAVAADALMRRSGMAMPHSGLLIALLTASAAQLGDLAESYLKRQAGVKDSGNIIPGHGGLLDRIDGIVAAVFVTAALHFYKNLTPPV